MDVSKAFYSCVCVLFQVLLNQTKLKLKRGYRYGLCGKNDSGKTSLMRAIANQQVAGCK